MILQMLQDIFNLFERHKKSVEAEDFKIFGVPYDSQRDNKIDPNQTCFTTSLSMVIRYLEEHGQNRDLWLNDGVELYLTSTVANNLTNFKKILYEICNASGNPRYFGRFWTYFINQYCDGFSAEYKVFSLDQFKKFLFEEKIPVCVPTKLTSAGHIIVAKGYSSKGLYCHDPYGCYPYKDNLNGEDVFYLDDKFHKSFSAVVIRRK